MTPFKSPNHLQSFRVQGFSGFKVWDFVWFRRPRKYRVWAVRARGFKQSYILLTDSFCESTQVNGEHLPGAESWESVAQTGNAECFERWEAPLLHLVKTHRNNQKLGSSGIPSSLMLAFLAHRPEVHGLGLTVDMLVIRCLLAQLVATCTTYPALLISNLRNSGDL